MGWIFENDRPIYAQLADQLRLRIVTGEYGPGERIASVRELAAEAGVNPNTMQRALSELESSGLIYSQRTSGRFVTDDPERIREARKSTADKDVRLFLSRMKALGLSREEIMELLEVYDYE